MYVMFLNVIKGNISIDTKKLLKIYFGDPIDKIHWKKVRGTRIVPFR